MAEDLAAEWVAPDRLRGWAGNPRLNDAAVATVVRSIERFGWGAPIVARRADGEVIAGHTRLKAALQLGLPRVPVRYLDVSEEEAHLLAVADNRTTELADWDVPRLHEILAAHQADLLDLGYSEADFEKLQKELLRSGLGGGEQDEVPDVPADPVTQAGDLWRLGEHRLLCGDGTSAGALDRLLRGQRAQALLTDPPYGVGYAGSLRKQIETGEPARKAIENDALDPSALRELLLRCLLAVFERCVPGAPYYVFGPPGAELSHVFLGALHDSGFLLKHGLVWVKNQLVLGRSDYHYQHESIWYGWKAGSGHYFGGTRKDVTTLHFDRPSKSKEHPTMKPVPLVAYLLERAASPGSLVLDPFGGSGTTLIACAQLGRRCCTVETDPGYCDVIVRRWENLSGEKAQREGA